MRGTITKVILERGFGFIAVPNGVDLFFHMKSLEFLGWDEQLTGRRVEFDLTTDQISGKQRAMRVRPTN